MTSRLNPDPPKAYTSTMGKHDAATIAGLNNLGRTDLAERFAVERTAKALFSSVWSIRAGGWRNAAEDIQDHYREMARVAIGAYRKAAA